MTGELATVDPDTARRLLHQMVRIRRFEERCVELYSAAKIRGSFTCTSVRKRSPPGSSTNSVPRTRSWPPTGTTVMRLPGECR